METRHVIIFFLSAGLDADVESFVVETDYNDYAIMVMLSTNRVKGTRSKFIKLYSEWQKKTVSSSTGALSQMLLW